MNALIYIGIFLAGFLTLLIITKRDRTTHDYILIAWLAVSGLLLFSFYYDFNHDSRTYEAIQLVGMVLPLAAAPILYFYVSALVRSQKFILLHYLYHFIPFVFIASSMLYYYYNLSPEQALLVDDGFIRMSGIVVFHLRNYGMIMAFFSLLYPCISLYLLFKHKKSLTGEFSSLKGIEMAWLRNWIMLALVGFWFSFFIIWSGSFQWIEFATSFKSVATMITLNIAIVGFYGLKQTTIFTNQASPIKHKEVKSVDKYQSSRLSEDESTAILTKLKSYMNSEKTYLDTQLSLETLAGQLGLSKHDLSQVINEQLGVNFFTFVNQYRIEEFKRLLKNEKFAHYTMLGIALESGFNSKSSFNSVFKKLEGITPGAYKNSL